MKPTDLIHAMATNSRKHLMMAAVMPGGIMSYLSAKKRVKMEEGGPEISNPILVGGNPNVGPATYYDHVPVTRTSELDTVRYNMTRIVGTYVISDQEIDENKGSSKLADLAAAKMSALEHAFKTYTRTRAAGTNAGRDPLGIGNLLPPVNTTGSIGGINLATTPLFRPEVYDFTSDPVTSTNIEEVFDDILLDLNVGDNRITVIFVGRKVYNMHRAAARGKQTIQTGVGGFGKSLAKLGLVGTDHQGIPLVYDEELDPNTAYFVNENQLMLHILKSANMKKKDLVAPYDQDVTGSRYVHEYQLCSWKNHRTHAFFRAAAT